MGILAFGAGISFRDGRAQGRPGTAFAQARPPAYRVERGRPVERKGDEFGTSADIFQRNGSQQTTRMIEFAAVGRMIAIVAHHENVIFRNRDLGEIVECLVLVVDDKICRPVGKSFAQDGYAAHTLAVFARPEIVSYHAD